MTIIIISGCGQSTVTNNQSASTELAGEGSTKKNEYGRWKSFLSTDDFGDVTDESDIVIGTAILGDFSNTATASSNLIAEIFFRRNPSSEHYIMEIALLEYADTPATYLSSDSITLKTKVDDTVLESSLIGMAPNGNLFVGLQSGDYYADAYFNELYTGLDIRCIITIGNSKYNFTIPSGNFQEICSDAGFGLAYVGMTPKDAALKFLEGEWGASLNQANKALLENREYLDLLNNSDLKQLLGHQYFEISSPYAYWNMYDYTSNYQKQQTVYFKISEKYGLSVEVNTYPAEPISIVENTLAYRKKTLEIRKIMDGIYVAYELDGAGNVTSVERLMFLWDDSVTTENALSNMIDAIRRSLMP